MEPTTTGQASSNSSNQSGGDNMQTPTAISSQVQQPAIPTTRNNHKRSRRAHVETQLPNDLQTPIASSSQGGIRKTLFDDSSMQSWKNLCMVCLVDMGEENPRQLCGKTRCLNDGIDNVDINYEVPLAAVVRLESDVPLTLGIEHPNNSVPMKRKSTTIIQEPIDVPKKPFITQEDFDVAVLRNIPIGWNDLDSAKIYKVHYTEIRKFVKDGEEKSGLIGEVEDCDNNITKVWLPSIVAKKLNTYMTPLKTTYMQPTGQKTSRNSGRMYHDANVICIE